MALVGHISGSTQSNSVIGISGSVIVANRPQPLFPSIAGTDVTFFVSGSTDGTGRSVFGGDLISSGSFNLKSGTGGTSQFSVNSTGILVNTVVGINTINIASATGNITTSGDIAVNGGDVTTTSATATLFNTNATNLAIGSAATSLLMGSAAGLVTVNGDLKVSGNDIQSSTTTALTLSGADVEVKGDLTVTGNDIKSSGGTTNITMTSNTLTTFAGNISVVGNVISGSNITSNIELGAAGLVTTTGDLVVGGNDIRSSGGFVAITLDGTNVIIPGDLTVNGSTVTANTTNLEIKDSVIGLGFASGTIAQTAGDRGWIGGLAGADNVMSKWDNAASEFAFARTTSSATGSFAISSYSDLHANNIQGAIVSASLGFSGSHTRLIDGTSAFIAGSGISITSSSNGAVTISTGGGIGDVTGPASSTQYAVALFDDTSGKVLRNSSLTTNGSDSLWVNGTLAISGSTTFGDATTDTVSFTARVATDLLPVGDAVQNLGSTNNRWANVYTGDLHLKNDRGDYTLIEEENMLTIRFNKTGKRYKFLLEAVPELDESPVLKF